MYCNFVFCVITLYFSRFLTDIEIEIFMICFFSSYFYLYKTVTEKNKEELQLVMFPNFTTEYDELFDI